MCCVCVSATVHTPVWRGGCTGSDPGLTRGVATLIRVCERGMRHTRHICEHLNEAGVMCARCECLVLGVTVCVLVCGE